MKEILGGSLENAFRELSINAVKTYEGNTHLSSLTQVWEVEDEDFDKLCEIKEEDWEYEWGWWRGAEGSNVNNPLSRFNINNHYITAWDGYGRLYAMSERDGMYRDRKYSDLLEYFCDEIGASTEKNVCAVAVDLAKINNIKLGELFRKYQG